MSVTIFGKTLFNVCFEFCPSSNMEGEGGRDLLAVLINPAPIQQGGIQMF